MDRLPWEFRARRAVDDTTQSRLSGDNELARAHGNFTVPGRHNLHAGQKRAIAAGFVANIECRGSVVWHSHDPAAVSVSQRCAPSSTRMNATIAAFGSGSQTDIIGAHGESLPSTGSFKASAEHRRLRSRRALAPHDVLPVEVSMCGLKLRICKRIGSFRAFIVISVVLIAAPALQAEHARIDLRVIGEGQEVYAAADQEPPAAGGTNHPC